MSEDAVDHKSALNEARNKDAKGSVAKQSQQAVKDLAAVATPMGAFSLLKQVNFIGDIPYAAAMGAALLKDLLDILLAATVILPFVFSALCTIFIFMMMLMVGANGKKKGASKLLNKIGVLLGGGLVDCLPGINFIPIEMLTVGIIYVMELIERKNAPK